MQPSPQWHLNKHDLITAGWVLFHTMVGVLIVTLIQLIGNFDFGPYTPLVSTVISLMSAFAKQVLSGPTCQVIITQPQATPATNTINPS